MATQTTHGLYLPDDTDVDIWGDLLNQNFTLIENFLDEIDNARSTYNTLGERLNAIQGVLDAAGTPDGSIELRMQRFDEVIRGPFTIYQEIAAVEAAKLPRFRILHSGNNWFDSPGANSLTINPQPDSYFIYADKYGYLRKFTSAISISGTNSSYVYIIPDTQSFTLSQISGTNMLGYVHDNEFINNDTYIVVGEFDATGTFVPYTLKGIFEWFEPVSGTSGTVEKNHNLGTVPSKAVVYLVFEDAAGNWYSFPVLSPTQRISNIDFVNQTYQETADVRVAFTRLKVIINYNIDLNNPKFNLPTVSMTSLVGVYMRFEA